MWFTSEIGQVVASEQKVTPEQAVCLCSNLSLKGLWQSCSTDITPIKKAQMIHFSSALTNSVTALKHHIVDQGESSSEGYQPPLHHNTKARYYSCW